MATEQPVSKGYIRLIIVSSIAWFAYCGWEYTKLTRRLAALEDFSRNPLFASSYAELLAEREALLAKAFVGPILLSATIFALLWVYRGFRAEK